MNARFANVMRGLSLAAAIAVAGCSVQLIKRGPTPSLYDLSPELQMAEAMAPVSWQLIVAEPEATAVIDTDRIVARSAPNEVKYLSGVRWSERSPRLVQSELVGAFDASGAIIGVGRQAIGMRGDYLLTGELFAFDVVFDGKRNPDIKIQLTLKVVRQPGALIVASKSFGGEWKVPGNSATEITAIFEAALSEVLSAAVPWTLHIAEADYQLRLDQRKNPEPMGIIGAQ